MEYCDLLCIEILYVFYIAHTEEEKDRGTEGGAYSIFYLVGV